MPALRRIPRELPRALGSMLLALAFSLGALGLPRVAGAQQPPIPSMFPDRAPFLAALEGERPKRKFEATVTGITVPHHLLAADLMARGFWAAATEGARYDRIIVISPDHFSRSRRPLATTRQDIDTAFGTLANDVEATSMLIAHQALFDESDLFRQEHGVASLLPFIKHLFPDARIVPIVVSYASTRAHWDAAAALLEGLITPSTLVVQSTDYSHYLTHAVAVRRDQESLNVIAAGDLDGVARLTQPDHMDSKGSEYIQMRLQGEFRKAHGTVIANRNSAEYSASGTKTTSYIVKVFTTSPTDGSALRYDDQEIVYFGGDTFIGRWLTEPLADPEVAKAVVAQIRRVTAGAPLVLNLEGVLLDDPPHGLRADLHMMHASLAMPILKSLDVRAASLANNHSHDLGANGFKESVAILKRGGITPLQHMQPVDMGRFGVVAVNFIGVRDHKGYPVVKAPAELQGLCRAKARSPLVAFVHWGQEYTRTPGEAEHAAAHALHACGVALVVGAHSHQAAARAEARQGGEYLQVFSLGNLLFDQKSDRASGALLELRVFKQGTFAVRLVPMPNLFEQAVAQLGRSGGVRRQEK